MADQVQNLIRWVRGQVFKERSNPLSKFVLRNANTGFRGNEVEEFDLPAEQMGPEQVSAFADQIAQAAQRDADASGTKLQRYMLVALELDSTTGPRFRFQVRGEGETEDDGEERPDKDGMISQMMRHNEALMRMATMGAQATITQLTRQLETANNTITKLNADRQQSFELIEEARSRQGEREIAQLAENSEQERKNMLFAAAMSKLDTYLPHILERLVGGKVAEGSAPAAPDELSGLLSGLSQQQIANIFQCLDAEQRVTLMRLFQNFRKPTGNGVVD